MNDESMKGIKSIYECWQNGKISVYCGSEIGALKWLSSNGGGIYKNSLHKFQFEVKQNEFI